MMVGWLGGLCALALIRGHAFRYVEEVTGHNQGTIRALFRIISACVRYIQEIIEISLVLLTFLMIHLASASGIDAST